MGDDAPTYVFESSSVQLSGDVLDYGPDDWPRYMHLEPVPEYGANSVDSHFAAEE